MNRSVSVAVYVGFEIERYGRIKMGMVCWIGVCIKR